MAICIRVMVRGPILAGRFLSACEPPNGAGPYPDHAFYPKLTHFYPDLKHLAKFSQILSELKSGILG